MAELAPSCALEEYGVAFVKNGRRLSTKRAKIEKLKWGRVLDGISGASVDLITAGEDCCGEIGAVDHWNTEMVIFAFNAASSKDEVIWRGPCMVPEFDKGRVSIPALDVLAWLEVRVLEQLFNFVDTDMAKIFIDLATYALTKDAKHIPEYSFVVYDSGVKESRKVDTQTLRYCWAVVQEMLNTGLDITTFGSQILTGTPAFTTIDLFDTDITGAAPVIKDGKQFANRVLANASRDIVGIYPPGIPEGTNGYPLVETILSDSQLQDIKSAENAAQARWEYSKNGVRRISATGGLTLNPASGIDVKRLLAGQLFNFQATETCYGATETMRLGGLNVEVTQGRQTTTIDLQPVGMVAGETLG